MTTIELLSQLRNAGVKLWLEGEQLRYSAPEGALTNDLRTEVIQRRPEILTILKKAHLPRLTDHPLPTARNRDLPLSFAQQRLWFLDQLEPNTPAYNVSSAVRISGRLDLALFELSLNEVIRRHEVLRTNFDSVDGEPIQVIRQRVTLTPQLIDLTLLSMAEREDVVRRLIAEEARVPFDLRSDALLRLKLWRLDDNVYILLLTMHHIISDAWSLGIFFNEITTLYGAFSQDETSPLPELPIQYVDFAVWQRRLLSGEFLQSQITYWQRQLSNVSPVLPIPTDHPRPAIQSFRGKRQTLYLGKNLTHALKQLSQGEGITLFMTLLAAFQVLLSRYTGEIDIVVGSPIANRDRDEIRNLIGLFVNTLILRTDLSGNPSFRDLLSRVQKVAVGAYSHQDLPFEKLVEELHVERDLRHNPVFQVMFGMPNTPASFAKIPGLTVEALRIDNETAKFDLNFLITESQEEMAVTAEYNTDLFDASTIGRMLDHFRILLDGVIANPNQRLSDLPLLTKQEQHQQLVDWNNTQQEYPSDRCFHELFEQQAAETPDAVAAICQGTRVSYRILNGRANRLAKLIVDRGVEPDTVVSLLAERGIDLLVAMLAVFKAGAAYLPLDPDYPAHRLVQILQNSGTKLILATRQFASFLAQAIANLPSHAQPDVLLVDAVLGESEQNLPLRCSPNHLAYVIYTSGSTGTPKGAMIEHRGMLNHLFAKISDLNLTASDVIAQTASQSFDISVWQYLASLLVGGTVHIIDKETVHDPVRLWRSVANENITIFETVPSMLMAILEEVSLEPGPYQLPKLRWLLSTGEALPPELCIEWLNRYPSVPILNAYGPTECSDDVTHYASYFAPSTELLHMPIGHPIANTYLYILDSQLQMVPIGVVGDLYVGGVGVGRGYLHNAERTAEVFLPNPFVQQAGARLYKTGDKARYLAEGNIEYLGRNDNQIKIGGYRIELEEVEAVLSQHPSVRQAVVVAREEVHGERRLIAYLVADLRSRKPGAELSRPSRERTEAEAVLDMTTQDMFTAQLRAFIGERLPGYMIPSAFIFLNSMPLTLSGKINRNALPEPIQTRIKSDEELRYPSNPTEEIITRIWEHVLNLEHIAIDENFFELGGTSLSLLRLHAQIRKELHVDLPLVKLFQYPTIHMLSDHLAGFASESSLRLERSRNIAARRREKLSRRQQN